MKNYSKKKNRRIVIVLLAINITFAILVIRLFWIQFVKGESYKKEASNQHNRIVRLSPARGTIFDRNLIPLTNNQKYPVLLVYRDYLVKNEDMQEYVKTITGIDDLSNIISQNNQFIQIPFTETKDIDIQNMLLIDKTSRYSSDNILSHVIGYVKESNNKGESGLEKSYNDILTRNEYMGAIMVQLDGKRRIIPGAKQSLDQDSFDLKPNSIKLTIDYNIQKSVEKVMDEKKCNGAVIVADVPSGDILAMASRPNIDLNNIEKYLNNNNMEFYNKALQVSYPPGSVFKTIVLMSALENNIINLDDEFYCKGYEKIGNTTISCHKKEGHGLINVKEAFSDSCNSVFIQIGKKVGAEKIIESAKKIGFGKTINIGLTEEIAGNLPEGDELLGPAIGNISIGQGNIAVTPLQVTNMIMIIANDGIRKDLTLVDSIVNQEGEVVETFKRDDDYRVISYEVNKKIKECLRTVVEDGTAKEINLDNFGGAAGKTGSAQDVLNYENTIHGWFSGYFPEDNPKYVITVLVEKELNGSKSAIPIFQEIAKEILKN